MSSESVESCPSSQSSASCLNGLSEDIVHILNIRASTSRRAKVEEVLCPDAFRLARQEYIILIQKPTESTIMKIRSAYNMHPVIEYECNSSSYLKDHMIQLDDCLFLTLTDIPKSGELNSPVSLKIIMMNSIMFLLIHQELHCIEEIFVKRMKFDVFNIGKQENDVETEDFYKKSETALTNYKKRFTIKLDLVEFYELTSLEEVLYKLLHVMFMRIEEIVSEMDNEVKVCNEFATELSTAERIDFVLRVHMAKKTLIYARNYVDSKAKLLPEIIESKFLTRTFNQYLNSMALNMKKLTKKIDSSMDLLKSSEHVHKAIVEGKLSDTSERSNDLLKVFSAITTICLPLNLVSGFFGMNIRIPFQNDEVTNVFPFIIIVGCSLCYLISIVVLFRSKGWL